jgi:hypothetical protein
MYFSEKVSRVKMEIGPLVFTSGNYTIAPSVIAGADRLDFWENAIGFTMTECQPFETKWEIRTPGEGVCVVGQSFSELD